MPIIGREWPADIVVPAPQVSARHAEILALGGGLYLLTDLHSANGTFVNGLRITSAEVRLTDAVRLGSHPLDLTAHRHVIEAGAVAQRGVGLASPAPASQSWAPPGPAIPARQPAQPQRGGSSPLPAEPVAKTTPARAAPGLGTDLAVALASQRSFTGNAFFVWLLYWLLWIPGFIMNLVYLSEAKRVRNLTGQAPSGYGCLMLLIIVHFWLPLGALIIGLVLAGGSLAALFRMFQ